MKKYPVGGIATSLLLILLVVAIPSYSTAEGESKKNIWSTTPYFNLIRPTNTPLDQFSFFINGAPGENTMVYATKHKESLHVRFRLTYAAQTAIELREGGQVVYNANIFFVPSYEEGIVPEEFVFIPFHTVDNETRCKSCHRFTIKPSDLAPGKKTQSQVCFPCHNHDFEGKQSLHVPAAVQWRCLHCHQPEARQSPKSKDKPLRFTVENVREISILCYSCHPKVEKQVNTLPFVHGPLGMGACNLCHDPHASKWPNLLENNVTTLCATCHDMQSVLSQPVVHTVLRDKGCTACHNAHASSHPLQLTSAGNDLCLSCHDAIKRQGNNHPVLGHPVSIKDSKSRARKDRLSCVSCHSPHASDYPKLIDEEEVMNLCIRCHNTGSE